MHPTLAPIDEAFTAGTCLLLVLSKARAGAAAGCTKVSVRPVVLQQRSVWQFTSHFSDKVTHANLDAAAAVERVAHLLGHEFEHASLYTPSADIQFRAQRDGTYLAKKSAPSKAAASRTHNRTKMHLIPDGEPCPFLIDMGVMTETGRVRAAMQHKFRQINRFLELVDDVVPALPSDRELRVVDFGCGKSYLTFALHHLLTGVHGRQVHLVGLDRKSDVIRHCNAVARRLNCQGLEFREGDIAEHTEPGPVDLAVSLHACDTATDDALAKAIDWKSAVILAVPCCQHELAVKIDVPPLAPLTRHGILHERFAALATDALRAQILEIRGYATQIVEFIDIEHTAKNVLIRAIRRERGGERTDERVAERLREYAAYKALLGIEQPYLERLLEGGTSGVSIPPAAT